MKDNWTLLHKISNPYKIQMLMLINTQPASVGDLSEHIQLSKPEISRHLAFLRNNYFISRVPDSYNYVITSLGLAAVQLLTPLQFILNQNEFFQNHLIYLPISLLCQINNLSKATKIINIGNVMMTIERIFSKPINNLYIMSNEQYPFDTSCKHAQFIFPQAFVNNLPMPKSEIIEFFSGEEAIELKSIEKVAIVLIIIDNHTGMIFFPDLHQKVDMTTGFLIEDRNGVQFLKKIWDLFWNNGQIITKEEILKSL